MEGIELILSLVTVVVTVVDKSHFTAALYLFVDYMYVLSIPLFWDADVAAGIVNVAKC